MNFLISAIKEPGYFSAHKDPGDEWRRRSALSVLVPRNEDRADPMFADQHAVGDAGKRLGIERMRAQDLERLIMTWFRELAGHGLSGLR